MTDAASRLLYFHTGTWKTGSTALQLHLSHNQARLAELGISYEFRGEARRQEGNGNSLNSELQGRHVPSSILAGLLEDYFAGRAVAICSSEDFTGFQRAEWEQIFEACDRIGVQARTITYVRDVAPYYRSMHAQLFKAGQYSAELRDFCRGNCYLAVVESLRVLHELLGRDAMSVFHYESTLQRVDAPFMTAIGVAPDQLDGSMLAKRPNRSFTNYEMELLRRVIRLTGAQYAPELSIYLIDRRPSLKPERVLEVDLERLLQERHQDDLAWINQAFFGGAQTVRLNEDRPTSAAAASLPAEVVQAIDRDVTEWCLQKLQSSQAASANYLAGRLQEIDWGNINNPALPADFDPIAYLLLNLDVMRAAALPCEHFLKSGRLEKGRRWRWQTR
jgi:hypothetical protein